MDVLGTSVENLVDDITLKELLRNHANRECQSLDSGLTHLLPNDNGNLTRPYFSLIPPPVSLPFRSGLTLQNNRGWMVPSLIGALSIPYVFPP